MAKEKRLFPLGGDVAQVFRSGVRVVGNPALGGDWRTPDVVGGLRLPGPVNLGLNENEANILACLFSFLLALDLETALAIHF
jgi:hypothetical protein